MKNVFLSIFTIFLFSFLSSSQSYIGHTVDNFAGIHGVIYNPANVVSSNLRADINLISTSILIDNDYLGVGLNNIADIGDEFDDSLERFTSDKNNFNINADILGPSFMFNLNKKSSIAITSRVRVMSNINNINGELFETIADDFGDEDNFDFDEQNFTGTAHAWAEIGVSYGRILISRPKHLLTGGVTLKYLQGAGGAFTRATNLEGNYDGSTEILQSSGSLTYGTSSDFDLDDINFDNLTSGFGFDIGFVYEWHPNRENEETRYFQDPYKLKVGVSITDIGNINYNDGEVTTYDMNNTVDTSTYEDDLQEFLDNNYDNTLQRQSTKFRLPTALHFLLDYRLAKKWLISAQADLSMVSSDNELENRMINTVTIAPRFESKWFSFYAPLSLRQYGDVAFGGGFRFGPLSVGSGTIFSNLLSDNSKSVDLFFGLKVPLFRK